MIHGTSGTCFFVSFRGRRECDRVRLHDSVLLVHTRGIDLAPLSDTFDVISNDIDYLTIAHKLYTFRFCSPLFSLVSVDHPSDELECVFADGSLEGILYRKCHKHAEHRLCSQNESIARECRVFHQIKTYERMNINIS